MRKNVWLYYLWSFLNSFYLIAAILVVFFKSKGLNQLEIQSIQTIFQWGIFLLEIPTGVVADKWGRKQSLAIGGLISGLGVSLYVIGRGVIWFGLCELVMALGMALESGANQALVYDSLKEEGGEKEFAKVVAWSRSLALGAIGLGALAGGWLAQRFSLDLVVFLNGLILLVSFGVSLLFEEPSIRGEKEVNRWKEILNQGWRLVRKNQELRWLMIESAWLYALGYFVIWLYQPVLIKLGMKIGYFGLFHVSLILLQVGWLAVWVKVWKKLGKRKMLVWLPVLVGLGFVIMMNWMSWLGVLVWFSLSGVFGLTSREIFGVLFQEHLKSRTRATVLSFGSMLRGLVVGFLNPLVGWLVDKDLKLALGVLGVIGLVGVLVGRKMAEVVEN